MQRTTAIFAMMLCVVGASFSIADSERGHLVLNGGGSKPDEVIEKFIELAGGPDALVVIFPTASEEEDTGEYYSDLLGGYGCTNLVVADVHTREDAMDAALAATVSNAGGIWFAGGDQRRITKALLETPVGTAVADVFRHGGVVGGTSAGTACQSELMITGDGDFTLLTADNVELWPGLGLFEGVIVDQHFVARKRHNRLMSVTLEHPNRLGVGVDEGTAIWVRPDETFQVLGKGWVVVYDASNSKIRRGTWDGEENALGVHGLTTHILLPGENFDLKTRSVIEETGCF